MSLGRAIANCLQDPTPDTSERVVQAQKMSSDATIPDIIREQAELLPTSAAITAPEQMLRLSRWKLIDLEPAPGYRGCLAAESRSVVLKLWVWSDADPRDPGCRDPVAGSQGRVLARGQRRAG